MFTVSPFSTPVNVVLAVVVLVAVHVVCGYFAHCLPTSTFERETWLSRERRWERGGHLYQRALRLRRWKHLLPEAGALFSGGFNKKRLPDRSSSYLEAYVRETRRAEFGHVLTGLVLVAVFSFDPPKIWLPMTVYAVVVNVPCVVSQRYARLRMLRILTRRAERRSD